MENDTNNLIIWAAAVAETVERNTHKCCSSTQVLNVFDKEKKKLINKGIHDDEANELVKVIVENILSRRLSNES